MSDKELVKRLRDEHLAMTRNEAAAAIEALTAENEMLGREVNIARYGQPDFAWSVHVQVMDDLNAKRAKALEALREIAAVASVPVHTHNKGGINFKKMYEGWRKVAVQRIDKARATLAEIEGEK